MHKYFLRTESECTTSSSNSSTANVQPDATNAERHADLGKHAELAIKSKKPTRRGKSRQSRSKKTVSLSILGSNANGLNGKLDSLKNAIKSFDNPTCIAIQETKLRSHNFKIPGYQVFQKNRTGLGGGLITAIDEHVGSVLVSNTDNEILVVQIDIEGLNIRVLNAYGPQEDSETESIHRFW